MVKQTIYEAINHQQGNGPGTYRAGPSHPKWGLSWRKKNSFFDKTDRVVLQLLISNSFYPFLKELLPVSSPEPLSLEPIPCAIFSLFQQSH